MNCYFRQIQKYNFQEVFTKKITKLFSVFFAVVLCIASMCSIDAFAEETSPISVSVKADFKYNNVSETITVKAKYELSVADIAVNTDNLEKKDNGSYKTADNFSGLSGKLNISDKIKIFTAETYDIHGEMTHSAAIEPKSDWKADDLTKQYGSVKNFLREKVGLTDDDFAKLRKLYLED